MRQETEHLPEKRIFCMLISSGEQINHTLKIANWLPPNQESIYAYSEKEKQVTDTAYKSTPSQRQGSSPALILFSRQCYLSHKGWDFWIVETLKFQCRHYFKEKSKKQKIKINNLQFWLFWLVPSRILDGLSLKLLKAQMWLQKQIFFFFFSLLSGTKAFAYWSTRRETKQYFKYPFQIRNKR